MAGSKVFQKTASKMGASAAKKYLYGSPEIKRQLVVPLPNGRYVKAHDFVQGIQKIKSLPDGAIIRGAGQWGANTTKEAMLREYREMIDNRINSKIPGFDNGRKKQSSWQSTASQLALRVNTPRLIVRKGEVPKEFRVRLNHRIFKD